MMCYQFPRLSSSPVLAQVLLMSSGYDEHEPAVGDLEIC